MPIRKNKDEYGFTYVILGLVLGFFLGSGIVYWYSNRQNDSILASNVWDYLARLFQGNEKTGTYMVSETELNVPPNQARNTKPITDFVSPEGIANIDTIADETNGLEVPEEFFQSDSLLLNESLVGLGQPINEETNQASADSSQFHAPDKAGMRIAQDRLLLIRAYNLPPTVRNFPQSQAIRQLDSLLGNYPRRAGNENMLLVEFWQSPLNFRGYKMSHHKLIVYGLDQVDAFSLHSDGKSFFIKYFENIYQVSPTLEYRPLTPLVDPVLIEEFQQRWP